jgi:ABC-2 type transport system ATP-binding protein
VHFEADPAALSAPCGSADQAAEVVGELSRQGISVANFSLGQPSLDEVFLALTGHTAEDQAEESQVEDQDQTSRSSASPAERSRIS